MNRRLHTAVILAGGKSSRMGAPKAWLAHHQGRLIDFIAKTCHQLSLSVYVSGQVPPYESIQDLVPNQGPMGGIRSSVFALSAKGIKAALFIPVDLPYLTTDALLPLLTLQENFDALCYQDNPLPLALNFNPSTSLQLTNPSQNLSVRAFLKGLTVQTIPPNDAQIYALQNTNTPIEWQQFKERNPSC